jgi:predicted murein hydrolase (TIGR00659 family)
MPLLTLAPAVTQSPLFGLSVTVGFYAIALMIRGRCRWAHPILLTCAGTLLAIWAFGAEIKAYRAGGDLITMALGPATVALAVPLYKHAERIRAALRPVLAGVLVGSLTGVASGAAFVLVVGGSSQIMLSMMPKSVTTPISMEISRLIGGWPELTAAMTVLTGLAGSIVGPMFLRVCGVRHPAAVGVAMGAATHGIGTARMLEDDPVQGSFSAVAMGLCGMLTTMLAIPWVMG